VIKNVFVILMLL